MNDTPPPNSPLTDPTWREAMAYPLGALGALLGAAAGAAVAFFAARYGFYAVVAVGVLTGVGAAAGSRRSGPIIALIAALVALGASLCTEASLFPFVADDSLGYFFTHLSSLTRFSVIAQIANTLIAGLIAYFR